MTARERAEKLAEDWGWTIEEVATVEDALLASEREGYRKGVEDSARVAKEYWQSGLNVYARQSGRAVESRVGALLAKGEG